MSWSHMCQVFCDDCNDFHAVHRYVSEAHLRDTLQATLWTVTYQDGRITRAVCNRCAHPEED